MEGLAAIEDDLAAVVRLRQGRAEAFGAELFSDPAWDILLALYGALLAGRSLRLDQLASAAPASTLARWLAILEDRGLISCELTSPAASPDMVIALSSAGQARMSQLFRSTRLLRAPA